MEINYSSVTWIIIGIFLVVFIACMCYENGTYANEKSNDDGFKSWDLCDDDFNKN